MSAASASIATTDMIMRGTLRACIALAGIVLPGPASSDSICYGTTANGRIEDAVRMPVSGANFRSYCDLCVAAGRTWGHGLAIDAVTEAYAAVAESHPGITWLYGEIGLPRGGPFPPHRTHQNGLSVDFMVPVLEGPSEGRLEPGLLPTGPFNRFGYDEEFDRAGVQRFRRGLRVIDFEAIGAHLLALEAAARRRGGSIARIYFAPDLQDELFATVHGPALRKLPFNRRQAWVRHDDHYHVDFAFRCRK